MNNSPEKNLLAGKNTVSFCMTCGRPMGFNHNCDEEEERDVYDNGNDSQKSPSQAEIDEWRRQHGTDLPLQEHDFTEE